MSGNLWMFSDMLDDEDIEILKHEFITYYQGADYYAHVADVYRKTKCQIVGHFDLVAKYNAKKEFFDPEHPRYKAAAQKAMDALLDAPVTLEVNTGGIAGGYTQEPYPAVDLLTRWLRAGKPVLFSSDCHKVENLLFGYDLYEKHLAKCKE